MKRITVLIGVCFLMFLLVACATSKTNVAKVDMPETTYSGGPVDVIEVMNTWNIAPNMSSIGDMPMVGFTNPNLQEDIRCVIVVIYGDIPIAYAYLLEGDPYVYFMNEETGIYEIMLAADPEQWKLNFQQMFLLAAS